MINAAGKASGAAKEQSGCTTFQAKKSARGSNNGEGYRECYNISWLHKLRCRGGLRLARSDGKRGTDQVSKDGVRGNVFPGLRVMNGKCTRA